MMNSGGGGGGGGAESGGGGMVTMRSTSPFTVSQRQELEHQALIFKYMMAGLPVPPDIVLPIQRSFESISNRFFHHSTMGYCSFYGKKVDPEPGRCRRTDGKKWRCSRYVYPDSKYCERHLHRDRNRSRKPVESQTMTQSSSTDLVLPIQRSFESNRFFHHPTMGYCSFYGKKVDPELGRCRRTDGKKWRCSKDAYPNSKYCERHLHRDRNRSRKPVESQTTTQSSSTMTSLIVSGSTGVTGSFQSLPLHAFGSTQVAASATGQSNYHPEPIPYGVSRKDYRYLQGNKPVVGGHSFFIDASGSHRDTLPLMQSRLTSFPQSKTDGNPTLQNDYPQHSFFSNVNSAEPVKHGGQSLRPFFYKGQALEDERSNKTSFSTTQLSISIPMASSDISTISSQSPHVGYCSFYGKKVDPEPGRCRRTDGKKWRCSKVAYSDSKYCERHLHRDRNRSRKPVES